MKVTVSVYFTQCHHDRGYCSNMLMWVHAVMLCC